MKHLIYLLALVLTLTACSDGLEEQKIGVKDVTNSINESEWTKYESSEYGFNFSYPSDWILEKDGDTIHIHSLEKDLYLYREYLDIELASSSFDDLKTEIENSDRLGDGTSLAQFNESIEVDINGVTSLKGEHATAIGTPVAFYYIPFGENGLWITRYNGFDEVEEKIISTFTIENDKEETPVDTTVEPSVSEASNNAPSGNSSNPEEVVLEIHKQNLQSLLSADLEELANAYGELYVDLGGTKPKKLTLNTIEAWKNIFSSEDFQKKYSKLEGKKIEELVDLEKTLLITYPYFENSEPFGEINLNEICLPDYDTEFDCNEDDIFIYFPPTENSPLSDGWIGVYREISGEWKLIAGD